MILSHGDLKIIHDLDDGTLYAEPAVVNALFDYPHMVAPQLSVAYDDRNKAIGYLPTGQFYADGTRSYIAAMPNSPPISPTYTPGAEHVLWNMPPPYFDTDIIPSGNTFHQTQTASAHVLPLGQYLSLLSANRRKDMRRKLKQASAYRIEAGTLDDVRAAWPWMSGIWDKRGGRFGDTPYDVYLEMTLNWLQVLQRSPRTTLKIDKFLHNGQMIGVNCCVIHRYRNRMHCDDYLCWYDPRSASGLGITSAVRNLTHPDMQGYRYNLGNPGVDQVHIGHEYKMAVMPEALRLNQGVLWLPYQQTDFSTG